jgi:hypothetical protein
MADLLMKMPFQYEPKKSNRFILSFPSSLGINSWYVEKASRPSIKIDTKEIKFLNTETYVAGSFAWETISVSLRDPIGPSAAQAVMEWVRLHAESVTGRMGYAAGYKKDVDLEMLDPTGVVVEKWILQGCSITDVKFGEVNYTNAEIMKVDMTLRPDRCILVY